MTAAVHHPACPSLREAGNKGPRLCVPAALRSPDLTVVRPVREHGEAAEISAREATRDAKRRAAVAEAKQRMADAGVDWATVRTWATVDGRWTTADLKAINPLVVAAYVGAGTVTVGQ